MSRNTQFPVALHILIALALRDEALNSAELAWSIDTNPSLVRRILATLKKAGLVQSRSGPKGGVRLARAPSRIPLLEVLEALEIRSTLAVHTPNPECPLGAVLGEPLAAVLEEADEAARRVLAKKTVRDVARSAAARIASPRGKRRRGR